VHEEQEESDHTGSDSEKMVDFDLGEDAEEEDLGPTTVESLHLNDFAEYIGMAINGKPHGLGTLLYCREPPDAQVYASVCMCVCVLDVACVYIMYKLWSYVWSVCMRVCVVHVFSMHVYV
jgi:hypothetical protein